MARFLATICKNPGHHTTPGCCTRIRMIKLCRSNYGAILSSLCCFVLVVLLSLFFFEHLMHRDNFNIYIKHLLTNSAFFRIVSVVGINVLLESLSRFSSFLSMCVIRLILVIQCFYVLVNIGGEGNSPMR